jgi:hypothetical protein
MKKSLQFIGGALALGAVVVWVWCLAPAPRRLSEVARRLDKVNLPSLSFEPQLPSWCSTNEILVLRELNQGDFQMQKVNVYTGQTQILHGLDSFFQGHENRNERFGWKLSANGQWFFGLNYQAPKGFDLLTCRLDGTSASRWSSTANDLVIRPDGSGWMEIETRQARSRVRSVSRVWHELSDITLPATHHLVGAIGLTPGGRCLECWDVVQGTVTPITLYRFNLDDPARHPEVSTIDVGHRACEVDGPQMSPHGDRIAWVFGFAREPVFAFVSRWLRNRPAVHRTMGLWVCNTDGTGLREIARAEAQEAVFRPRWLPDGKHVSVLYRDALWVVPVD